MIRNKRKKLKLILKVSIEIWYICVIRELNRVFDPTDVRENKLMNLSSLGKCKADDWNILILKTSSLITENWKLLIDEYIGVVEEAISVSKTENYVVNINRMNFIWKSTRQNQY